MVKAPTDDATKPGEVTQFILENEDFFDKLENPSAHNEMRDPNPETIDFEDSIAITESQAEALREENNPEKLAPENAWKPFECSPCKKKFDTKCSKIQLQEQTELEN